MARRSSLTSTLVALERDAARRQAAQRRDQARARREADRAAAAYQHAQTANAREAKALYSASRVATVAADNDVVDTVVYDLNHILSMTLGVDDFLDFDQLKKAPDNIPWLPSVAQHPLPAPSLEQFFPPESHGLAKIFGKAKQEAAMQRGRAAFEQASTEYQLAESARVSQLERDGAGHDTRLRSAQVSADAQHAQVDLFREEFEACRPEAVADYFEMILSASAYPSGFPQSFGLAYVPESRQLVIEYKLPTVEVVPRVKLYRYIKGSDQVSETVRSQPQLRALYRLVVAQLALRTVNEVFEADRGRTVDTVVFSGLVHTTDPRTGLLVSPCLITLRTTQELFSTLDLAHVEPIACLKYLSATISPDPAELAPVRPILEFDMVDPRFVTESDALSLLDQRPNLMDLSPTEFEQLIQNLFQKIGLESRQTRASRDGGVDCIAFDPRPIFGGKVVIQAKRYKNTVGVSAVRDLFGTLQNEGASKGILVTTSSYGQASFEFAKNKPIELLEGANLLYLLKEYADIDAKITPPDSWTDSESDSVPTAGD